MEFNKHTMDMKKTGIKPQNFNNKIYSQVLVKPKKKCKPKQLVFVEILFRN